MFNTISLSNLEKIGINIILYQGARFSVRGMKYKGSLLINNTAYQVLVIRYWFGGGRVLKILDTTKENAFNILNQLEDKYQEAFLKEPDLRKDFFKGFLLRLLSRIVIILNTANLAAYLYFNVGNININHMKNIIVYIVIGLGGMIVLGKGRSY